MTIESYGKGIAFRSCYPSRKEGETNINIVENRGYETKDLMPAVTKPVNQLSVEDKQREDKCNQPLKRNKFRRRWVNKTHDKRHQQDCGFPTPESADRDKDFVRDELYRETAGSVASDKPVDSKEFCHYCLSCKRS